MPKPLPFLLFIIFGLHHANLHGQGRYGSLLPRQTLISMTSANGYLYRGIDNFIRVDSSLIESCDQLFLTTTNGLILNDTLDIFLAVPSKAGNAKIQLHCIHSGDTVTLGYWDLMVHNIPVPKIIMNETPLDNPVQIRKEELYQCDSIRIYISNDIYDSDSWLKVKSFTIGYNYGSYYISHVNESNKVTPETRKVLYRMGPEKEISIVFTVESNTNVVKQLPVYRINLY